MQMVRVPAHQRPNAVDPARILVITVNPVGKRGILHRLPRPIGPMETKLIKCARLAGKAVAPGYLMSLEQAISQFTLYTGVEPPRELMSQSIRQLLEQ